ncbi:MAG: thiamine-phosphate kinase [Balneolaceae bacterium]|nr:thiamine-phosphate kinase [Balneolaceae bacterium]MBO6547604.1 thiamine-phosphate kinase [Balneolaceae bacterium]MBO6648115.1 thiamine-phosphate kinase [Balneolaceae bacterium]
MSDEFITIQSIGRKGLLKEISEFRGESRKNTVKGLGDDAAVIKEKDGSLSLLTTDTFVEGVDFDPTYTPFTHFGYKIISASVSDIYAMNGNPNSVLVNLALPNRMSVQMVKDLYRGIDNACKKYELELVGGDLTGNHSNAVISVSVYGKADEDTVTYRKGASIGDAICVTGDVGAAIAGLRILMREKRFWEQHGDNAIQPDLEDYKFVVQRQLMPEARKDLIEALTAQKLVPTSMIDITKGVINEVTELCSASDLGAYLYQAALPIAIETRHVADEMEEGVDKYALFGGEDLELLFTLSEKQVEQFIEHFKDFAVIGRMTPKDEGLKMQTAEGDVLNFDDLS